MFSAAFEERIDRLETDLASAKMLNQLAYNAGRRDGEAALAAALKALGDLKAETEYLLEKQGKTNVAMTIAMAGATQILAPPPADHHERQRQ